MNTKQLLDALADLYAQVDYLITEKNKLIDQVTPQEIKDQINDINAEFEGKASAVGTQIAELEMMIKTEVIQAGESIKGTYLQAVYMKPRTSWNTSILEGMAVVMPELLKAKKPMGEPFVSFRKVGK